MNNKKESLHPALTMILFMAYYVFKVLLPKTNGTKIAYFPKSEFFINRHPHV